MPESGPQSEEAMLEMAPWEFDQSPDGWRRFAATEENLKAARLIQKYIVRNREWISNPRPGEKSLGLTLMNFHVGQLLAVEGHQYLSEAIEAFTQSFEEGQECWNAYVSATIGFLEGDAKRVDEAIKTVELSKAEDKRWGNLGIVKNLKKALQLGEKDLKTVYSWTQDNS